jgi:predicted negative regulator of RcsB-dependent stress response
VDDLISEKEQIEQLRSWWSEYGGYVIGGLALGIALLAGLNYYTNSKLEAQLEASVLYESLTQHVVSGSLEAAETVADDLGTNYAATSYAPQAQFAMARLYMDKNRDQDAADALSGIIASEADEELKFVARARLARVLLYQNKAQEVVDMLEGQQSEAFGPVYQELLGDAYHALGRVEDAQAAYQGVMLNPRSRDLVDQQLIQWKALDLPEASATDDVVEEAVVQEPTSEDTVEATEAEETE